MILQQLHAHQVYRLVRPQKRRLFARFRQWLTALFHRM